MAITWHADATPSTNTTAGTSSTVANLVVTAGDFIIVGIATVNTAVSAVSDTINTYRLAAGPITNGTSIRISVWCALAKTSTTITTITATVGSSRRSMTASSYSGAVQPDDFEGTFTGSATPITGSTITDDNNNFAILVGGGQGTTTYAASVGNLRGNIAGGGSTTPGVFIADNTSATPASTTVSVTITNSTWSAAMMELRNVPFFNYINAGQTQPVINPIEIVDY